MGYEHILYDVAGRIATVTLNRPERLNAWTLIMEREVREAVAAAAGDDGVRAIVLTGAGRGFCAGADMDLLQCIPGSGASVATERPRPFDPSARGDFQRKYSWFPAVPKPIVAAVNGATAGLGLVLALYCDVRLAAESAVFTTSFSRRGLVAEHGISWLLPRLVGPAHALDLLLSARKIDAVTALGMGLVNQVLPQAEFRNRVNAYAGELATLVSPRSMRVMKRQIWEAQFQTLAEATDVADAEMRLSFASEDFREGVAHFVEKRVPAFTGR